jgi:hypothetical protein
VSQAADRMTSLIVRAIGEWTMPGFTARGRLLAGGVLAAIVCAAPTAPAVAQQKGAPPNFSSDEFGWVRVGQGGPDFDVVPGEVPPVTNDPTHPFVGNGTGRQPTYRIADLSNPNLKPWVKELMKKDNDEVLAGKIAFTARQSCLPAGVPGFMAHGGPTQTSAPRTTCISTIISRSPTSRISEPAWSRRPSRFLLRGEPLPRLSSPCSKVLY